VFEALQFLATCCGSLCGAALYINNVGGGSGVGLAILGNVYVAVSPPPSTLDLQPDDWSTAPPASSLSPDLAPNTSPLP
jgi:hypothetical protein